MPPVDETFTVVEGSSEFISFGQFEIDVEATSIRMDSLFNGTLVNTLGIFSWDISAGEITNAFVDPSSTFGWPLSFTSTSITLTVSGEATTSDFILVQLEGLEAATVPLPAAAWLFGSGLLGLLGVSRRKAS